MTRIFNGAAPLTGDDLQSAVVQIFGDVPAIITSEVLRNQFRSLPYEAVLAWVKVGGVSYWRIWRRLLQNRYLPCRSHVQCRQII